MIEFVTLVSRTGDRIERSVLDPLTGSFPRGAHLRATGARVFSEHGGRRVTVVRSDLPGGPTVLPGAWVAFDGIAVAPTPTGPTTDIPGLVSKVLGDGATAGDVDKLAGQVRGNFMLCGSLADGTFVATADTLGTYALFVATLPTCYAVGNNALLLETALSLAGAPPRRVTTGRGIEAVFGCMAFESTGFEEVRLLPLGYMVQIAADGALGFRVMSSFEKLFEPDEDGGIGGDAGGRAPREKLETLLDRAAHEISENVRGLASGSFHTRISDLTGGFDSRVVLAAILAEGVEQDFGFFCNGSHPGPDYSTATYLQDVYQLREARDVLPSPVLSYQTDPTLMMRRVLYRTMGCYVNDATAEVGDSYDPGLLRLGGGLAGAFRGIYSRHFTGSRPEEAAAHLLGTRKWDARRPYLTGDFAGWLGSSIRTHFAGTDPTGLDATLDQWYIVNRNRYHFGIPWRVRLLHYSSFHPLYSLAAVAAAYAMPAADRVANRVGFELMRRLYEPLTALPFAKKRWSRTLTDPLPDARLYREMRPFTPDTPVVELTPGRIRAPGPGAGAADVPPSQPEPSPWAREQLRLGNPSWTVCFDTVLPAARGYVGGLDPASGVWDVFDRRASLELVNRPLDPEWTGMEMQIVYKLLAAGVWLSRDEVASGRRTDG